MVQTIRAPNAKARMTPMTILAMASDELLGPEDVASEMGLLVVSSRQTFLPTCFA
jgi:hypothetical protein